MKAMIVKMISRNRMKYNLSMLFGDDFEQNTKEKRQKHKR